jgi:hypothetical protein
VCQSLSGLVESSLAGQRYLEFAAACNLVTIKTYWSALDPALVATNAYTFRKINKTTGAEYANFPATITAELRNGILTVVSTHSVTDNQVGDSNPATNNILDPYTLVLGGSSVITAPTSSGISGITGIVGSIRSGTINILKLIAGGFGESAGGNVNSNTALNSQTSDVSKLEDKVETPKSLDKDSTKVSGDLIRTGGFSNLYFAPITLLILVLILIVIRRSKKLNLS